MGSHVTYQEDRTARIRKVKLVYPHEANIEQNLVSILTPIGAALIGMSPAQAIEWPNPTGGMESLTVLDVRNELMVDGARTDSSGRGSLVAQS